MHKDAISVTLGRDNLLWLRARARAAGGVSVSRLLDDLVTEARAGKSRVTSPRTVAGTIDLTGFDPDEADRDLRALFEASHTAAGSVHEPPARYRPKRGSRRG